MAMVDTNWIGPSNYILEWSNRGQFGLLKVLLANDKDDLEDDDVVEDAPTSVISGEKHERRDEREDIEYEQLMRKAMRRSIEDCGHQHGHDASYQCDCNAHALQYGGGSSQYGYDPQGGSQSRGGNHGSTHYNGSSHGGSQYYSKSIPHGSYGHQGGSLYGGSSQGGSQHNAPTPPPNFGSSYYGNYRQGGAPSRYVYNNDRGPYGGLSSIHPSQKDDNSFDLE